MAVFVSRWTDLGFFFFLEVKLSVRRLRTDILKRKSNLAEQVFKVGGRSERRQSYVIGYLHS